MAGAGVAGSRLALAGVGSGAGTVDGPGLAAGPDGAIKPVLSIGGSGHGIIGMRERVSLLSGEFSAGPLPGYGFQVSAHIPLPPEAHSPA
jgi:hypothetical protein